MIRKHLTLFVTLFCLALLSSCSQARANMPNTSNYISSTPYSTDSTSGAISDDKQAQMVLPTVSTEGTKNPQVNELIISNELQDTAFDFFKAYIQADIETAKALIDSENNECLSYFSTYKRSLDSVEDYALELVYEKCVENNGVPTRYARIDILYRIQGVENITYMCLALENTDMHNEDAASRKGWVVTFFDFEA